MIVDGSIRMKRLIDGILAYSRAGRDENLETIDTKAALQRVLADLSVAITESKTEVVLGKLPSLRFVKTQFSRGPAVHRLKLSQRAAFRTLGNVHDRDCHFMVVSAQSLYWRRRAVRRP
jgi:hypothetical protein